MKSSLRHPSDPAQEVAPTSILPCGELVNFKVEQRCQVMSPARFPATNFQISSCHL